MGRAAGCSAGALLCIAVALLGAVGAAGQAPAPAVGAGQVSGLLGALQAAGDPALRHGRELLASRHFAEAKQVFIEYQHLHPGDVQAEVGLGDAQLGGGQYEAAETTYRTAVAQQPELWQAHKNLVVVEAALHRWEEFDRERTVLRLARERGAPGISARESDVIDSFTVDGQRWVVRAYFEPLGRSEALYNFERFSPDGRVAAFVSLENARAARAALAPSDVRIGVAGAPTSKPPDGESETLALNWYTGAAHGIVRTYVAGAPTYGAGAPTYERLRADVLRWLNTHPAALRARAR